MTLGDILGGGGGGRLKNNFGALHRELYRRQYNSTILYPFYTFFYIFGIQIISKIGGGTVAFGGFPMLLKTWNF